MENKVMELLNYLFSRRFIYWQRKKGNNYVIDEVNNIAKIELHRTKAKNLWTIIDLEDLERVINGYSPKGRGCGHILGLFYAVNPKLCL